METIPYPFFIEAQLLFTATKLSRENSYFLLSSKVYQSTGIHRNVVIHYYIGKTIRVL